MMAQLSLTQKVVAFLMDHPNQKFKAREIAVAIAAQYADDFKAKREKFASEKDFISRIVAEMTGQKKSLFKQQPNIMIQDNLSPQVYWYSTEQQNFSETVTVSKAKPVNLSESNLDLDAQNELPLLEQDVYPKLIKYLNKNLSLHCLRIDERKSKNNRGKNGNQWLHPDIVAMQALDSDWSDDIRRCVKIESGNIVRLWSFEVKVKLNSSNVRESFFQAVSNSSWANEGYLVATSIADNTLEELRILSALHGIGVIILDMTQHDIQGQILLPARRKSEIDWQSVNRIAEQNDDFATFVGYIATYYQTGKIFKENWNK